MANRFSIVTIRYSLFAIRYPKHLPNLPPQHRVDLRHRRRMAEVREARHAVALIGDAARHDAGEMREIGIDVERDAMQADPAPHADADGRDLVFPALGLVGAAHPYADAVLPAFALDVERRERTDEPFLEVGDEAAYVAAAPFEVEHHI